MLEMESLNYASLILSAGLPETPVSRMPAEVAETLTLAREQMRQIPAVIEDIAAAQRAFDLLDRAISRMSELAREAAGLTDDDQAGRDAREEEFVKLAQVVARVAGRDDYRGPKLTITSKAQAEGSIKILKHLDPVKAGLAAQLRQQRTLVIQAVQETVVFLETIAKTYPEEAAYISIPDLLGRVKWVREYNQPDIRVGDVPQSGLH